MRIVETRNAPAPNGHYSQAVVANGLVFLSAQLPIDPRSQQLATGLEAQVHQVIANCRAILQASGSGLDHVLSASIYLTDITAWPLVDAIWTEAFEDHRPARGVFGVDALHLGASIAIQMSAIVRPPRM
jgi:2-iminobutanoate/2-iminopropanoate deaminase